MKNKKKAILIAAAIILAVGAAVALVIIYQDKIRDFLIRLRDRFFEKVEEPEIIEGEGEDVPFEETASECIPNGEDADFADM